MWTPVEGNVSSGAPMRAGEQHRVKASLFVVADTLSRWLSVTLQKQQQELLSFSLGYGLITDVTGYFLVNLLP